MVYVLIKYAAGYTEAQGERRRLLVYPDAQGQRQAALVKLVADSRYLHATGNHIRRTDFSGLELTYNWQNDQFLHGTKWVAGKAVGRVSPLAKGPQKGQKTAAMECTTTTTIYYSYSCTGSSCTDPVEVGRESFTTCVETDGGSSGTGDSGDSGGSGGGPLGGGTNDEGCGPALVCPDGSTNPGLIIIKVFTVKGDTPELQAYEYYYMGQMSESEKVIYNAMTRPQQVSYLLNAQMATSRAESLYSSSTRNDGNGDAFRHAHFGLLNTIDLGIDLARRLGTAHKNRPAPLTIDQMRITMDLYNNNQGRLLYGTSNFPENAVINLLNQGGLRIIVNRGIVPSHP